MERRDLLFGIFALVMMLLTVQGALAASITINGPVKLSGNDPTFTGPVWQATLIENGNSQYVTGEFSTDQFKLDNGTRPTYPLKVEISNTQNTCQYAFLNTFTPISKVNLQQFNIFTGSSDCTAAGGFYYYKEPVTFTTYCYVGVKQGSEASIRTPNTVIRSNLKLTAAGDVAEATINNVDTQSVLLKSPTHGTLASAEWQGNLVSGAQCPNPGDYHVVGVQANGKWQVSNEAAWKLYDPSFNDLKTCVLATGSIVYRSAANYQACADEYNTKANAVLTKTSVAPFTTAVVDTQNFTIAMPVLIQYPQFNLRVKADWLGIYVPSGTPQIVSVTTTPFTEGNPGNARVLVKNVGDGTGTFVISGYCPDAIGVFGVAQNLRVQPGETGYLDLPFTGTASGSTKSVACTITATEKNPPMKSDSKQVTMTVNPLHLCNPAETKCLEAKIVQCNQQGTAWIDSQVCSNGLCVVQNGVPVCQNAEVCSTDSQCDDHDPTTVDACVGVLGKTCQHKVVPLNTGFDFGKYGKLILWIVLAAIFGVGATVLGKTQGAGWYALHIVTGIAVLGAVLSFFALFSTFAAIMLALGLILIVIGIPLAYIGLMPYALGAFGLGIVSVIIALALTFVQLPGWLS